MPTSVRRAIILAGGYGSRMGSVTGMMHKGTLPVDGKPNLVWLIRKLKEVGVRDVYISTHHLPDDIGYILRQGGRFGDVKVHYSFEEELNNTASATSRIVNDKFKRHFQDEKHVWVLACDIGFPKADLGEFKSQFLTAVQNNNGIQGGLACVVRPVGEIIRKRPTLELDSQSMISDIHDQPPATQEEAEDIRRRMVENPHISSFETQTQLHGLPLPTFFYILSVDALKSIKDLGDRSQTDVDFMRHLFKAFPNQLWAHFLAEKINNGILAPEYYDMNEPEDFYRAQWIFMRNAFDLIELDHSYLREWNSYKAESASVVDTANDRDPMVRTVVRNCVMDEFSWVKEGVVADRSWIGHGCIVQNAVIERSILLPFTEVNYPGNGERAIIRNSIVGGQVRGSMKFNPDFAEFMSINCKFATPGEKRRVRFDDLNLSAEDIALADLAFRR